jgi:hypothetical protein
MVERPQRQRRRTTLAHVGSGPATLAGEEGRPSQLASVRAGISVWVPPGLAAASRMWTRQKRHQPPRACLR